MSRRMMSDQEEEEKEVMKRGRDVQKPYQSPHTSKA